MRVMGNMSRGKWQWPWLVVLLHILVVAVIVVVPATVANRVWLYGGHGSVCVVVVVAVVEWLCHSQMAMAVVVGAGGLPLF